MEVPRALVPPAPTAPARVHLVLAASMWTAVGVGLLGFGAWTAFSDPSPAVHGLVAVAILAGVGKARWVLTSVARRVSARILQRGDGKCVGGFLAPSSWVLVAAMVAAGRLLRAYVLPRPAVGLLYVAVGTALLLASRSLWSVWSGRRT